MRERAGLVGATLEINDRDPGPGAEVQLELPIRGA
jgi:signal transduction histidine kinase